MREPSPCAPAELPELVSRLDTEFVTGRGRSVSLALRFPSLFDAGNADNIWAIRNEGRIAAALVTRHFIWIAGSRQYNAAMIGMVWTDPALRGKGLASLLLEHVTGVLKSGTDFAVLWTAQPEFYLRLGWMSRDRASFGEIEGGNGENRGEDVAFERVRQLWEAQPQRAARGADWNPPLPLPATALEMFVADGAYAIAGRQSAKLYCHEILGNEADFPTLFERLRASCGTLYINERIESQAYRWLDRHGVRWRANPLAMWLALRNDSCLDAAHDWYIPWLDRI